MNKIQNQFRVSSKTVQNHFKCCSCIVTAPEAVNLFRGRGAQRETRRLADRALGVAPIMLKLLRTGCLPGQTGSGWIRLPVD